MFSAGLILFIAGALAAGYEPIRVVLVMLFVMIVVPLVFLTGFGFLIYFLW
jgi:hypothetical protein